MGIARLVFSSAPGTRWQARRGREGRGAGVLKLCGAALVSGVFALTIFSIGLAGQNPPPTPTTSEIQTAASGDAAVKAKPDDGEAGVSAAAKRNDADSAQDEVAESGEQGRGSKQVTSVRAAFPTGFEGTGEATGPIRRQSVAEELESDPPVAPVPICPAGLDEQQRGACEIWRLRQEITQKQKRAELLMRLFVKDEKAYWSDSPRWKNNGGEERVKYEAEEMLKNANELKRLQRDLKLLEEAKGSTTTASQVNRE